MAYQIQVRSDLAVNWLDSNPILAQGEPGYEVDTGKIKYGDGSTAWATLPYFTAASNITPSGPNASLQFNNSGTLGGSANLTFDNPNKTLSVSGNVQATNFIGSGNLLDLSNVTSNIIPATGNLSLGTLTHPWKEMFVSANTIYINGVPLSVGTNVDLTFNGAPVITTNPDPNTTTIVQGGFSISGDMNSNTVIADSQVTAPLVVANVIQTANVIAESITGNGAQVFDVHYANLVGAYGDSNVAEFLPTYDGIVQGGLLTSTANIVAVGNIAGSYFIGNGAFLTGISGGNGTNYSNANVTAFLPTYGGYILADGIDASSVSATGNITGGYILGNGAFLTGISGGNGTNYSNANVASYLPTDPTIQAIESNIANLSTDVTTLQGNVSSLDSQVSTLQSNVNTLNSEVTTLQGNVVSIEGSISTLSNSVANLQATSYSNANVANYLPTDPTIISLQGNVANLEANSYSNANVASYLATYSGNVTSDSITANALFVGNATSPGSYFVSATGTGVSMGETAAQYVAVLSSGIDIAGTAGVTVQGINNATVTLGGSTSGNINVVSPISLGDVSNISIAGGLDGYYLQTDGNGHLTWSAAGGGNGSPGGSNTQIQFNNNGVFAGTTNLTWDGSEFSVTGNTVATYFIGDGSQLTGLPSAYSNANVANYLPVYSGNVSGDTITANYFQVVGNIAPANPSASPAPFLTGFDTVSALHLTSSNTISATGNITGQYFIGNGSQLTGLPASYSNSNVESYLPTYSGNLGNVGIANTLGVLMGTPTQGNLSSNAVTLTTSTALTDGIALLNTVLGKLVPPAPPAFPASQTLAISGLSTYRMANITQVNNTANSLTVAAGTTVTKVLRTATYSTNTITNAGPGDTGVVTAYLSGNTAGSVTLTGSSNGTYGNLVITSNQDYHVANSSIQAGFWYVFSSQLSGTARSGWNDVVIVDSAAGSTNVPSWYYDNSSPGTPSFSNTSFAIANSQVTYSSTVAHYNSSSQWSVGFTVANISGNTYPTSNTFVTGTAAGAFQAPVSVTYNQSNLASNIIPAFASANVTTTSNVTTGFGSSSSGPSVSVNNSYATGTQSFTPGVTVNYKTGTTGSLTFLEESNIYVGGQIGSGVVGSVYRISNPGNGDTPVYTGSESAFNSQTGPFQTYDAAVVANVLSCNKTNYSTGYLPVGPNLSGQDNTQYFTFKFVAPSTSKFDIYLSGRVAGLFVALPGSAIDTSSTLNGWLDMSLAYAGAGQPGAGSGGNGSNGSGLGTLIPLNTTVTAQRYTCTFGTASTAGSTGNEVYVRVKLTTGQTVTSLAIYPSSN